MKLKNLFYKWAYNDVSKDFFVNNREKINLINGLSLNTLNDVAVFIYGVFCIFIYLSKEYNNIFHFYFLYLILFIIINLLYRHIQIHGYIINSKFLYFIIALIYLFGIYIGCYNLPTLNSVMYPVFVICLPLLFILPTLHITGFTLVFTIFYIISFNLLKPDDVAFIDFSNIIACSIISAVTSYTVTCARLKEIKVNTLLEHACNTDELTGLHNRRSFNNFIINMFDNSQFENLSLMMIDIDNFKDYNDTYGHIYGDNCLITIGKIFKDFELKNDCYIARFGGEEFVLVDYRHSLPEVELIAKNLIQMIYDINIENINSKFKKVTISIGISSKTSSDTHSYIDLINLADDALYQAKNNGKNRLMIARHTVNRFNRTYY